MRHWNANAPLCLCLLWATWRRTRETSPWPAPFYEATKVRERGGKCKWAFKIRYILGRRIPLLWPPFQPSFSHPLSFSSPLPFSSFLPPFSSVQFPSSPSSLFPLAPYALAALGFPALVSLDVPWTKRYHQVYHTRHVISIEHTITYGPITQHIARQVALKRTLQVLSASIVILGREANLQHKVKGRGSSTVTEYSWQDKCFCLFC